MKKNIKAFIFFEKLKMVDSRGNVLKNGQNDLFTASKWGGVSPCSINDIKQNMNEIKTS